MGDSQSQKAGDGSILNQAGRDVVEQQIIIHQQGVSASEFRQIALDIFKANALELAGMARDLFETRVRELIDTYLQAQLKRNPERLESFRDPDMQHALFTAQKDYGRSGSKSLENILIELLVQRSSATDLRQIVLNEAIAVAAKLTPKQLDLLSFLLIFVHEPPLTYCFSSLAEFSAYLCQNVVPLLNDAYMAESTFLHLKSAGCASMDSGGVNIVPRFQYVFPLCFRKGFSEAARHQLPGSVMADLMISSFHDPGAYQFMAMDPRALDKIARERGLPDEAIGKIIEPASRNGMIAYQEAAALLDSTHPSFRFLSGGSEFLTDIQLTTVGIALANANLPLKTELQFDLGYWIK
jgi:hypothetical protein